MRKNLLIATFAGLCFMGMAACQQGNDTTKPVDTTEATAPVAADTTAIPAEQPAISNEQTPAVTVVPEQTAPTAPAANSNTDATAAQQQPTPGATTDTPVTTPVTPDAVQAPAATDVAPAPGAAQSTAEPAATTTSS